MVSLSSPLFRLSSLPARAGAAQRDGVAPSSGVLLVYGTRPTARCNVSRGGATRLGARGKFAEAAWRPGGCEVPDNRRLDQDPSRGSLAQSAGALDLERLVGTAGGPHPRR